MKNKEFELLENAEIYDQYLSFVDLEKHPDWENAWKNQDEKKVNEILHSLGVDLDYGWEIDVCMHRVRTGKQAEYGPRFSFKERTDREWMRTNMALEDIIRNTPDKEFRKDMIGMSQRINLGSASDRVKAEMGDIDE